MFNETIIQNYEDGSNLFNKTRTLFAIAILFLSGYSLFKLKSEVQYKDNELRAIERELKREYQSINLLKAEFAYLSSPDRIAKLSKNFLKLSQIKPNQMISDPLNNEISISTHYKKQIDSDDKSFVTKASTKAVKWRYKRQDTKYVHTSIKK